MKTFITSDTHLGHVNILKYCSRPHKDVISMNMDILDKWNAVVSNEDEVYHLGDVGQWFKDGAWIDEVLPKLNGIKRLILGNHDKKLLDKLKRYFQILPPIHNIRVDHEDAGTVQIVLCHYPIWSWEGRFHGSIHCYGHTHAHIPELPKSAVHVGVDTNNFTPVSTDEIVTIVTKRLINNES